MMEVKSNLLPTTITFKWGVLGSLYPTDSCLVGLEKEKLTLKVPFMVT